MEAEQSHSLLSANKRPRKAGGVIQSESRSLRTGVAGGVNPSLGTEDEWPISNSKTEKGGESLLSLCLLFSSGPF